MHSGVPDEGSGRKLDPDADPYPGSWVRSLTLVTAAPWGSRAGPVKWTRRLPPSSSRCSRRGSRGSDLGQPVWPAASGGEAWAWFRGRHFQREPQKDVALEGHLPILPTGETEAHEGRAREMRGALRAHPPRFPLALPITPREALRTHPPGVEAGPPPLPPPSCPAGAPRMSPEQLSLKCQGRVPRTRALQGETRGWASA